MITLRLFHQSNPFTQIDERLLDEGELIIGRDAAAGWSIADPERELSRFHCLIERRNGQVTLRDTSANGVFVGSRRERITTGDAAPIAVGETIRLGQFLIVVDAPAVAAEQPASSFDAPFHRPMLESAPVDAATLAIPSDWSDTGPVAGPRPAADGSLLEAFCAGARLDASAFSGEEPAEVMRRLGAVYQQMVLGLGDLMDERTTVKAEYRLERTTVRAEGNNPFRWAPAHRVAVDLLRPRDDGFLSGPAAVRVSFEDLKKHLLCMLAGLRAALASTLDRLDPDAVEEQLKGRSFLNARGAAWSEYGRLYAEFRRQADGDPDSPINREFRNAYERRLQELDAMSTRS